jgi:hypothetical protein
MKVGGLFWEEEGDQQEGGGVTMIKVRYMCV